MQRVIFAWVALVWSGGWLHAGEATLVWEKTEVNLVAEIGQKRAEAAFPFHNAGTKPVTITGVDSSCGCTTAKLAKTTYAPGEAGEIRAIFEFGPRTGLQEKMLTVTSDDVPVAKQLMLRVMIPVLFGIEQRIVLWSQGAEPDVRTVVVRTAPGVAVKELTYDAAAVEASFAPLAEGGGYALSVRVLSTAAVQRQTVMVNALIDGKPQSLPVHLFVR